MTLARGGNNTNTAAAAGPDGASAVQVNAVWRRVIWRRFQTLRDFFSVRATRFLHLRGDLHMNLTFNPAFIQNIWTGTRPCAFKEENEILFVSEMALELSCTVKS